MNLYVWVMNAKVYKVESCALYFALNSIQTIEFFHHVALITHDAIKSVKSSICKGQLDVILCQSLTPRPFQNVHLYCCFCIGPVQEGRGMGAPHGSPHGSPWGRGRGLGVNGLSI